jgi:hypothetical protein
MVSLKKGNHEKEQIHGSADGCDPARGGQESGVRSSEEARDQRAKHLYLAQAVCRPIQTGSPMAAVADDRASAFAAIASNTNVRLVSHGLMPLAVGSPEWQLTSTA